MDLGQLPPRLAAIAELIPADTKLVDVGTDHGLLPIWLLQEGRIDSAIASDIRSGPLSRAKANASEKDTENIRFVLCDGLAGISPDEADTIVIAGMGGETIVSILSSAPWSLEKILILQPMSRPEALRGFLCSSGLRICEDRLVRDNGKIYSVIKAQKGEALALSDAELCVGPLELISCQPLFQAHLNQWMRKVQTALEGLCRARREVDSARIGLLGRVYNQLLEMSKTNIE